MTYPKRGPSGEEGEKYRKAEEPCTSLLKGKASEKAQKQRRNSIPELNEGKQAFNLPGPKSKSKTGATFQNAPKNTASYIYQLKPAMR